MYKWLRALVGISILLLLIYFFDFKEIISEFREINVNWVYLVGLTILGSTLLGAISMFLLVSREDEILFFRFLPVYWASWSIGLVVPGQIGDVASISLLLKRLGFEWSAILARSLVDKVISLSVMLLLAIYGLTYIVKIDQIYSVTIYWVIFGLILFVSIFAWKWKQFAELVKNKKLRVLNLIHKTLEEIVNTILNFPLRVFANVLLTMIKILFIGSAYWFMFKALGYSDLHVWDVIPLVAASSLVAYLPISLNGIGTVELSGILLFSSIGMPEATVLTAFLLLRVLVFILAWVPTSLVLFFARETTGNAFS